MLSDRLRQLETQQIVSRKKDPADGRQVIYELTDKGKDLRPTMLAVMAWARKYDPETNGAGELAERIRAD